MSKLEAFGYYLQKPPVMGFIIINILIIFFIVNASMKPTGIDFIDIAFNETPWWLKDIALITIVVKNISYLYNKFEKWCKCKGI